MQKVQRELHFITPMECLDVDKVGEGAEWLYEIKHDGYRAIAIKQNNEVRILSRTGKMLSQFPNLFPEVLKLSPRSFILDGEVVAIDDSGRQSFNLLQNVRTNKEHVTFYAFDLLHLNGKDLLTEPLSLRRKLLESTFTNLPEHVKLSPVLNGKRAVIEAKLRELEFEGIIAKRRDSIYEPGKRSGAWQKHKTQRSDEFVVGGYIGLNNVDELVVGEQRDGEWYFVESVKNGFVPATRHSVYRAIEKFRTDECPFVNLPEKKGEHNFDREKMKQTHWVKPHVIVEVEFNERTPAGHLRHAKFRRLRDDKM